MINIILRSLSSQRIPFPLRPSTSHSLFEVNSVSVFVLRSKACVLVPFTHDPFSPVSRLVALYSLCYFVKVICTPTEKRAARYAHDIMARHWFLRPCQLLLPSQSPGQLTQQVVKVDKEYLLMVISRWLVLQKLRPSDAVSIILKIFAQ